MYSEHPSLLGKWLPSNNTSSKETRRKAGILRPLLNLRRGSRGKAHSFKISWDKNSKKASQRFKSREVTYRVVDGHDMVSFIHSETNGNVIVTSIAKINGHAVHSRNVFGISLQSYGQCQMD